MIGDPNFFKGQLKFFILLALSKQPLHGYKLMQTIGDCCMGIWHPTAGSLYPALEELKKEGFIELKKETKTGRKKKEYNITKAGLEKFKSLSKHVEEVESNILKFKKDPELSKYSHEDSIYLFGLVQKAMIGELAHYKGTLLEFAMLSRHARISKKQTLESRKALEEFLRKINEINKHARKKQESSA